MKQQTRVYVWGFGMVLLVIAVLLALRAGGAELAIGDSLGTDPAGIRVSIHERSGGISSKTWTLRRFADCTPNMPDYVYYPAGVPTFTDGTPLNRLNWTSGNAYEFQKSVYATSGFSVITEARPRQHPGCVEEIRDFAASAGVNVTEVVYVTSERNVTTVERVYVDQTVYVCEDGKFATQPSECASPVAVAKPYGPLARFWAWLRGLFA